MIQRNINAPETDATRLGDVDKPSVEGVLLFNVMEEIWKDVQGFEGVYQVSNHGRLKSLKTGWEGRILSNTNANGDYFSIVLVYKGIKTRYVRMHVLVLEAFIGQRPSKKHHVHHKDGNKQNNCITNIEYITTKDHYKESLVQHPQIVTGMRNYNKYIKTTPILQFTLSGSLVVIHSNGKDASDYSGVCQRNILQVAHKTEYKPGLIRKQAGGFIWELQTEPK